MQNEKTRKRPDMRVGVFCRTLNTIKKVRQYLGSINAK